MDPRALETFSEEGPIVLLLVAKGCLALADGAERPFVCLDKWGLEVVRGGMAEEMQSQTLISL